MFVVISVWMLVGLRWWFMEYCNVIIMVVFIGRIIVIIFLVKFLLVIIIIYCEMYEVNVLLIKEVRKLE